ncbi:ATP phosphoribosyltransferase regulatory subunit [Bacillota bacterium Meth-B3]|nr:ATP phosphoribosyltransferase regulatory subunit [Christensenellaceae bacterium]MEA5067189.1 ATP phosphoribosyltransferase regulatory subunit [Eubacteriales bacterium]MEA5068271.1 ATP phosphoribosyltransferase regulatory subunit [Christensenellaceae bacterium]
MAMEGGGFARREEQVTLELRAMYERHGYRKYRMSKFEAYELYLENINFLKSRSIITFNGPDGRVLALRPDVTLSIVKNTRADRASSEKFYYLENVYRLDKASGAYREIAQLGLEYLGARDAYATSEVLMLAARTLNTIDPAGRMQLSHVGFLQSLMEGLGVTGEGRGELARSIRRKNAHELAATARALGLPPAATELLEGAAALSGAFRETLARARAFAITPSQTAALDELEAVGAALEARGAAQGLTLDFSLLGDMDYYSGVAFQGYVPGVPRAVLAGGGYAALLARFGRDIDAIGFAVYLNELSFLYERGDVDDVDVLLIYGEADAPERVARAAGRLIERGLRVRCERRPPRELRAGRQMTLEEVEADA